MDFLARREYGRLELVKKLAARGFDHSVAESAIGKLTEEGLQSDRRFAENFVQARISRGKGPVRLRLELGQRGIGEADIETAIEASGVDWSALAREVHNKKFGGARPSDFSEKAKQMRFLQYRGFEPDHIRRVLGDVD
jgi:regulatory protein